jgi:hypothetical protein
VIVHCDSPTITLFGQIYFIIVVLTVRAWSVFPRSSYSCHTHTRDCQNGPLRKVGVVEKYYVENMRAELDELLKKQAEVLESLSFGTATDTELIEYDIRQKIVHELCNELVRAISD